MKRKHYLLAIVGLVGLLWLFVTMEGRSTWRASPEGPVSPADRDVDLATGAPLEEASSEIAAPASRADGSRQAVEAATTEASDAAVSEPERRLVIRDVDDRELHEESGEFVLEPRDGAEMLVPFHEGRFSLRGFPEGMARIARAKAFSVDEDRAVAFEEEWFEFKRGEPTLLVGHYLPDCTLRVVDARTGGLLDDVNVLPRHAGPEQGHPGPHFDGSYVVRGGASPVRLPRTRGLRPYWVTARGYGWSYILVDHETGGERVVEVEPGGRLVVEVQGDIDAYTSQSLRAEIRVYYHATESLAASSGLGPRQGFKGVAVGTYDVKVELGSADGSPIVLGETQVDVTANATCTARIGLVHHGIPPRKARVRGEIVVPSRYRALDLRPSQRIQPTERSALRKGDALRILPPHGPALRYRDVLDMEHGAMDGRFDEEDGSEVFRWEAELSAGRYLFVVEPVQHGVLLDVPESPDADIRIALPELFPVTLRAIDAETGRPIDGAGIRWSRQFTEGVADGWVELDLESGAEGATVYLTEGRFLFAAIGPNYGERSMDAYAGSGTNEFTLELSPCILREIILMHRETVVPWAQGMACSFRSFGSEDSQPCENSGEGKMRAGFGQPGLYEILFGEIEGFRDLAPVVVEVSEGDQSPVLVQLER